jgi:hypothetical protein
MSDSEEPLSNTPLDEVPVSEIGEPLPAPLATVEQGQEMEVIWRMVNMVTPTKGTNSNQLKKYWSEFMARFRHYQHPLDESRTLLVVCHIPAAHLTRNLSPKEIFGLFLDEKAFSVWAVDPPDERGILHFKLHPVSKAITGWRNFTMMENSLPDIALTNMHDWKQGQILMVNTYRHMIAANVQNPFWWKRLPP